MQIEVAGGRASVSEASDLKRLAVRADSVADLPALGALGTPTDDGGHVWLVISELRAAAADTVPEAEREAWREGFDGMIAYATQKGWLDDTGTCVRAHVELLA